MCWRRVPCEGWTKIPSSLPAYIYFSHLFSSPKFSPLLPSTYLSPPTYHLPPPSYLPPTSPFLPTTYQPLPPAHSIARALETSSRSELGAGELGRELGAGAWSSELGAGERLEPERDPGKHLTFFFLVYFVCLFVELLCTTAPQDTLRFAAQHSEEGNVALQLFFCCAPVQRSERRRQQRCCHRLLPPIV